MPSLGVGDLPPELTSHPLALVALLGLQLDSPENAIHTAIWESFSTNRLPDRAPINFRLLQEGHEFPPSKPKRTSYERYVPKGLLKTSWLSKHLYEIPAVAVLFYKLDWDDPNWIEKRTECAAKLEALRASLQGRNTKVALALIQKTAPLPGGDDMIAAERAASLFSACDLSAKSLFVLPHSDHLFGYTLRLENAFYELAQSYYHQETRRIKNHREYLNKTTHQLLFVRHQFKIAFLSELKQDIPFALKHYKQAYSNLMEVRASDSNMLEVKTIAGFINYKICHLSFLLNTPLDSISQFRKHVDIFKPKMGPQELAFEHSAWLAKQFSHFGDLFDEAVKQGLTAIQIQHPGFYYQQAANHAINRKLLCQKLCKNVKEYPKTNPLEGMDTLEYYGQRPWRSGSQSMEPADPQKEAEGIQALQYVENTKVDHSMMIIPLLSSAVAQFKMYKCPRMRRQLMVQMGEEYYASKDYSKALTLLRHVLWDYRAEKWRVLVSSVLNMALRCAYLIADIEEYVMLGLEFTGSWIQASTEEKAIVQASISHILAGKPPIAFPGTSEENATSAENLWQTALKSSNFPFIFTIQMGSVIPFVDCKVGFNSRSFSADEKVTLNVYLRTNCSQPIKFSKLNVLFKNEYYNKCCEIPNEKDRLSDQNILYLQPHKTQIITFHFLPSSEDVNGEIQISSVALQLGSESYICSILHWMVGNVDTQSTNLPWNPDTLREDVSLNHLIAHHSTSIVPRSPCITINVVHETPALLNEYYTMVIEIVNEELSTISNVLLSAGLQETQNALQKTTLFYHKDTANGELLNYTGSLSLGRIMPGERVQIYMFMRTTQVDSRKVVFKISYDVEIEIDDHSLNCCCYKETQLSIDTIEPWKFAVKLLNMKFEPLNQIRCEEPFLMKINISSQSTLSLQLLHGTLNLCSKFSSIDKEIVSSVQNVRMEQDEAAAECFLLVAPNVYEEELTSIGTYTLKWKRCSTLTEVDSIETLLELPSVIVHSSPMFMELEAPAHGWLRTPMTIIYNLHNRTSMVQDIELFVDSSDAFMYAGNKQLHFRILPKDVYRLSYNLYPLIAGYVPLPRLRLILNSGNSNAVALDNLMQEMLPSHIHIMPQGKVGVDLEVS